MVCAEGDLARFVGVWVVARQRHRVVENANRVGEVDAVLSEVLAGLGRVPLEVHQGSMHKRAYTASRDRVFRDRPSRAWLYRWKLVAAPLGVAASIPQAPRVPEPPE